ncbi:MAG: hypothetical protein HOV81_22300, partial [Kofleriaceae bacterium]|nr:hypothetical protein [Kofleriaceae bacterium]
MTWVQPVSVHIAVLSVAKDPKHPDHDAIATAVERATGAGHKLVEQATVKDSEPAVREQLTRWVTDSNVDVVLVLAADSDTASSALKPLVSSVLPGFTDLFRWLAFEEIGASAMLSQAEAAQCGQAYVFVLPGAIGAAMDKLILPQLDPKTTPKNLVSSLPRLKARTAEAVPTAIHGEKTQGGAGLPPKLPAMPSVPTRSQTKTGANVIPRHRAVDDPPTKPIDLERLQKEIARSEANDQSTRRTDLAKLLPKLPPGADGYLEPDAD